MAGSKLASTAPKEMSAALANAAVEAPDGDHTRDVQDALAPVIDAVQELAAIKEHTGRAKADIIT